MINDTILVSEKITPADPVQIDRLADAVGGTLPAAYREYMKRFGIKGEYADALPVWSPEKILDEVSYWRDAYDYDSAVQDTAKCPLNRSDFDEFFRFASTVEGDGIIYVPRFSGELFIIQRHASEIVRIPSGFTEPLLLTAGGQVVDCPRYFTPAGDHWTHEIVELDSTLSNERIAELVVNYWGHEARSERMPKEWYGDNAIYVFVKSIGGKLSVITDPSFNEEKPYIDITFDREHADKIARFAQEIRQRTTTEAI